MAKFDALVAGPVEDDSADAGDDATDLASMVDEGPAPEKDEDAKGETDDETGEYSVKQCAADIMGAVQSGDVGALEEALQEFADKVRKK